MSRTLTPPRVVLELGPTARRSGLVGFSEALLPPDVCLAVGDHVVLVDEAGEDHDATVEAVEPALVGVRYVARLSH